MSEKRNIKELVDKESDNLHNILDPNDVTDFKGMVDELRDTWTKKQIFRTETEMRFSVLNDLKYPTKASKYWQCVREQNVYLENLMSLSFEYRRDEVKLKRLEQKIKEEKDPLKKENDDGTFDKTNVDTHQLESYHKIMINRKDTLTAGSTQPEVFNVLGQLQTIERVKKEKGQLESTKRETLSQESTLRAKPE